MLYKVSEKIARFVFGDNDENLPEYIYGIELFFSSFVCTVLLLLIGAISGVFTESVVFIVGFSALRIYTGGYHSKSFIMCNISTLSIYFTVLFLYTYLYEFITKLYVTIPVFGFSLLLMLILCPVENENNPLESSEFVLCKAKATLVLIIEIVVFYVFLYVLKIESIAIIIPSLLFVDVLIAVGLLNKERGRSNEKQ